MVYHNTHHMGIRRGRFRLFIIRRSFSSNGNTCVRRAVVRQSCPAGILRLLRPITSTVRKYKGSISLEVLPYFPCRLSNCADDGYQTFINTSHIILENFSETLFVCKAGHVNLSTPTQYMLSFDLGVWKINRCKSISWVSILPWKHFSSSRCICDNHLSVHLLGCLSLLLNCSTLEL